MALTNSDPKVLATIDSILSAPTPMPRADQIRNLPLKELAKHVRGALKDLNIKGVSVTAPKYSMAQAVRLEIPEVHSGHERYVEREACSECVKRWQALVKLEKLVIQTYPCLNNRSDGHTDYFNYRLSVGT